MVMNPKIVVRPWSRVQNCQPIEAILQGRISVGPGLVSFAPGIAIQTASLPISKRSKTHPQANPILLRQCIRWTNNKPIRMLGDETLST